MQKEGSYEYSVIVLTNFSEAVGIDHFCTGLVCKMHFGHKTGGSRFYKESYYECQKDCWSETTSYDFACVETLECRH